MKRAPVESSNIKSIGHNKEKKILEIEFKQGRVYQYIDVPEDIFKSMMNAQSKGKFLQKIKTAYKFSEVKNNGKETDMPKEKVKKEKETKKKASDKVKEMVPQVLERLPLSSIELSRDAKGIPRWSIKIYEDVKIPQIKRVAKLAISLDKWLQKNTMVEPHDGE